jgi:hypothetical protein
MATIDQKLDPNSLGIVKNMLESESLKVEREKKEAPYHSIRIHCQRILDQLLEAKEELYKIGYQEKPCSKHQIKSLLT